MGFPDLNKLERLTVTAFTRRTRRPGERWRDPFEAMFNPSSIAARHANVYDPGRQVQRRTQQAHYRHVEQTMLDLSLLFDGSGVDRMGFTALLGGNPTVADRIAELLAVTHAIVPETHEPPYLTVTWGRLADVMGPDGFRCRLSSADIRYTSFNRDGSPLRAQVDIALVGDDDLMRQAGAMELSSPDLTHHRVVTAGDTLPLMTTAIYGSPAAVWKVARANDLDTLRTIAPGRDLLFPPVEKAGRR